MLKARCKRLAGRSKVLGNVSFSFNGEGICEVPDQGNNRIWFEQLCRMNGVEKLTGAPAPRVSPSKKATKPLPKKVVAVPAKKVEAPAPEAPKAETKKVEAPKAEEPTWEESSSPVAENKKRRSKDKKGDD